MLVQVTSNVNWGLVEILSYKSIFCHLSHSERGEILTLTHAIFYICRIVARKGEEVANMVCAIICNFFALKKIISWLRIA